MQSENTRAIRNVILAEKNGFRKQRSVSCENQDHVHGILCTFLDVLIMLLHKLLFHRSCTLRYLHLSRLITTNAILSKVQFDLKDGLPELTVPLPSRNESCVFQVIYSISCLLETRHRWSDYWLVKAVCHNRRWFHRCIARRRSRHWSSIDLSGWWLSTVTQHSDRIYLRGPVYTTHQWNLLLCSTTCRILFNEVHRRDSFRCIELCYETLSWFTAESSHQKSWTWIRKTVGLTSRIPSTIERTSYAIGKESVATLESVSWTVRIEAKHFSTVSSRIQWSILAGMSFQTGVLFRLIWVDYR